MKLHLIYEDEFSDLDDTDLFGEPGYTIGSGVRTYNNLTLKINSKIYTNCKARVKYDVDYELDASGDDVYAVIENPFVKSFAIGNNFWEFFLTNDGEIRIRFRQFRTGIISGLSRDWKEFDGGLSNDDIELIISQIIEFWELDKDSIAKHEYGHI